MPTGQRNVLCCSHLGADWIDKGTMSLTRSSASGVCGLVPALHGPFDQQFKVLDSTTGRPVANTPYRIRLEDGTQFFGRTDFFGLTHRVGANRAQMATLEIPYHGNSPGTADSGEQSSPCSR